MTGNMLNLRVINTVLSNNVSSNGNNKFAYLGGVESPYSSSTNNNKIVFAYTGTYFCKITAVGIDIAEQQVMLTNETADSILVNGFSAENAQFGLNFQTTAEGSFTISGSNSNGALSSPQVLSIKHWANDSGSTSSSHGSGLYDMGRPLSAGSANPSAAGASASPDFDEYGYDTYLSILIWKVG